MAYPFDCPACRKTFRWTAELAGRRLRCACGAKLRVPPTPGGVVELLEAPRAGLLEDEATDRAAPAEPETYELNLDQPAPAAAARTATGELRCGRCNSPVKPSAKLCLNCGLDLEKGHSLATTIHADATDQPLVGGLDLSAGPVVDSSYGSSAIARALAERRDEYQPNKFKSVWLPAIIAVLGVAGVLGLSWYGTQSWAEFGLHLAGNIAFATASTVVLIVAVFCTAYLFNIFFGPLVPTLIKLAALGIAGGFFGDFFVLLAAAIVLDFGFLLGLAGMIGIVGMVMLSNALFVVAPGMILFDLNLHEAGLTLLILGGIKLILGLGLLVIVFAL